jgi:hypothetical protein
VSAGKLIQWVEPWAGEGDITLICRMRVEDAIKAQRLIAGKRNYTYESDVHALLDFMVVHWAIGVDGDCDGTDIQTT